MADNLTAQALAFDLKQLRMSLERDARATAKRMAQFADSVAAGHTPDQINGFEILTLCDKRAELIAKEQVLGWMNADPKGGPNG